MKLILNYHHHSPIGYDSDTLGPFVRVPDFGQGPGEGYHHPNDSGETEVLVRISHLHL